MRYIPITCEQREAMLRAVGVSDVSSLFSDVPDEVMFDGELAIPSPMGEMELASHLRELADSNSPTGRLVSFAGAGCYDHYIPSIVDHVIRKPEFFTAYTPYQPEVSQGTLQAIYEFQSMICELTGMEVANASMYDGATALVEAAFMAARVTKRSKIVVSEAVHPEWIETLDTYAAAGTVEVVRVQFESGVTRTEGLAGLREAVKDAAAVLIASPNYFGSLEDLNLIGELTHEAGGLLVVATNPMLLGVMEPPAGAGADIVVGEGQPLGNSMSLGGPAFGFFACRQKNIRQMPGRLVGRTVDVDGNDAFVLTFSTREQHIRRERATSNICSNQALCALSAAVYMSAVGRHGLADTARACVSKAHYLRERLIATGRFTSPWDVPFGYEFALSYQGDVAEMQRRMLDRGYLAGVDLSKAMTPLDSGVLLAVTERRTRAEMDSFVREVESL
ncbi:MAG: aminomethyl-transferring glycine dehydrogenase subunit GcvPA [Actinomycetota bacterium]|jgi:glycine dehydrogenase subunit 1|nr:aminomethyl-transferring glycine dehydrogenase subunit GcvPA [Actinomycetota bacterium]